MNILPERLNFSPYPNPYSPSYSSFGLFIDNEIRWYTCREEFATNFWDSDSPPGNFIYFEKKSIEVIAEFIARFEELVEVGRRRPIHRSAFQKITTNHVLKNEEHAINVIPGPFWLKQPMRHSLFTILLRCASYGYEKGGDFWSALFMKYQYATQCSSSIHRFLDGYTWYVGKNNGKNIGWYETFSDLNGGQFDSSGWNILVRPQKKEVK